MLDIIRRSWLGEPLTPGERAIASAWKQFFLGIAYSVAVLLLQQVSANRLLDWQETKLALILILLNAVVQVLLHWRNAAADAWAPVPAPDQTPPPAQTSVPAVQLPPPVPLASAQYQGPSVDAGSQNQGTAPASLPPQS